jgi:hydroxypyruvate isomerase
VPRFSANLAMLWTELPFLDRFASAAAAGFDAVEYLFPYAFEPAELDRRMRAHGLEQELFNLPAGDFVAGERGIANDPARREEFRDGVESALRYADALACRKINCLVGRRVAGVSERDQLSCVVENLGNAAARLGAEGRALQVELLNPKDTPGFFVDSIETATRILDAVPDLRFQCDVYHLQRTCGDLVETIRSLAGRIGHVQIADAPGRHEPGTGEIAYPFVLRSIDATGYDGRVGLEYAPSGRTEDSFGWIEAYGYARGSRSEVVR